MNFFEPRILLCFLLFNLVLCWDDKYFHAKGNITLTCDNNNAHIWYIKEHNQQKDSVINENDADYFIRKNVITIYKPINNAVYKTKIDSTDDFFHCEVTVKLYVYPEEYNAYFTFNDISKNVSFQYFRGIPSHYEIPLFTDNPEHFKVNYSYKVEGIPLSYLKINEDFDENKDKNCFTSIPNYKCLERNEIIDKFNVIPKILQINFSYFSGNLHGTRSRNLSIGHISIDLNIEYRPKLESSTIIIDKPEKYILNCTEKYSNPPVKTYKWNSTRKEFQTWNITSPIYELEYNETLDDITFTCNASNEKYYSLAYFKFIKPKKIQDNSLKNWEITLIVIGVSLGCIIVVSIIIYMKKKSSCKKENITPSTRPQTPTENIELEDLKEKHKKFSEEFGVLEKIIHSTKSLGDPKNFKAKAKDQKEGSYQSLNTVKNNLRNPSKNMKNKENKEREKSMSSPNISTSGLSIPLSRLQNLGRDSPIAQTIKQSLYDYIKSNNMVKIEIKPDGHCLINSVLECLKEHKDKDKDLNLTFEELAEKMKNEFKNNKDKYINFLGYTSTNLNETYDKFDETFKMYIEQKKWDDAMLDLSLLLIVNALHIRINTYTPLSLNKFMLQKYPCESGYSTEIHLLYTGAHYDAIVNRP